MKKRFVAILTILFLSYSLIAQEPNKQKSPGKIGITFSSFGENSVFGDDRIGSVSYNNDHFYTVGINYIKPINNWLEFESGLEYSKHSFVISYVPADGISDNSPTYTDLSLVNVPITLRASFLKYFFVNSGLFLDIDTNVSSPIDSQTGIGALAGIAAKYDFGFGGSIFINPYLKFHSLIPFSFEKYHQKVYESGIRIGVTYNLKR